MMTSRGAAGSCDLPVILPIWLDGLAPSGLYKRHRIIILIIIIILIMGSLVDATAPTGCIVLLLTCGAPSDVE